jgi:membrane dipeptidase
MKMSVLLAAAATLSSLVLPAPRAAAQTAPDPDLQARAEALAHEILIVDTHVDLPYRLVEGDRAEDVSQPTGGDFDLPRARKGGLDAPFMSIYIPASYQETGGAKKLADELIDLVESFATRWPDDFAVAKSPAEVHRAVAAGKVALPLGIENGAAIEGDLRNLAHFHERGVRYITLTHSENNAISDSSYADPEVRKWDGLSPFGKAVVREMNRLGIMVDVSHISDAAFDDVMAVTQAPVIASHSSLRHFTPGFERNLSDDMVRRIADNGGVVQINFGSSFLRDDARNQGNEARAAFAELMKERGLERGTPETQAAADAFREEWRRDHPQIFADLSDVADHIDRAVRIAGVDHVGFGSDFDGVGDSLPTGLKDVSQYPNLLRILLERGYSEADVTQMAGGNVMRVWRQVEAKAEELQARRDGAVAPAAPVRTPTEALAALGLTLPEVSAPVANYVRAVTSGDLVFLAGHGPLRSDGTYVTGKLGGDGGLSIEQGYEASRLTCLALLASLREEIGDLDRVKRVVRVFGMVNSDPSFTDQPAVVNGCSDLLVEVFGDAGRHARAAVGMASLPIGIAVEIEMVVEVASEDEAGMRPRGLVDTTDPAGEDRP